MIDITSHIEIRMLPPTSFLPFPLLYITFKKHANHIYVFYASDPVCYVRMSLSGLSDEPCCRYVSNLVPASSTGESFV